MVLVLGPLALALALAFGFGLWTRRMYLWNSLEYIIDTII